MRTVRATLFALVAGALLSMLAVSPLEAATSPPAPKPAAPAPKPAATSPRPAPTAAPRTAAPATSPRATTPTSGVRAGDSRPPAGAQPGPVPPKNQSKAPVNPGVKQKAPPPDRPLVVPPRRVSGRNYTAPNGYRYRYQNPNYYQSVYTRYPGGYPMLGTPEYFILWNDPFYGPNYRTPYNPWFGRPIPRGYHMRGDVLVSNKRTPWGTIFKVFGIIVVVGGASAVAYTLIRRRTDSY